ncbi:hypothetical protein ACFE04_030126 [Oxalis oulophora]
MVFHRNTLRRANEIEQQANDLKNKFEEARERPAKMNEVIFKNLECALATKHEVSTIKAKLSLVEEEAARLQEIINSLKSAVEKYEADIAEMTTNMRVLALGGWENALDHVMKLHPELDESKVEEPTIR